MYSGIAQESENEVTEKDAFLYAKEHLDYLNEKDKQDFIEWFFSGNWIKKEDVISE